MAGTLCESRTEMEIGVDSKTQGKGRQKMKKKWIAGILCIVMAASLMGCGSKDMSNDYITIGKYEGLEIGQSEPEEVTDEIVEQAIANMLASTQTRQEITDRASQTGDTVNIDYVGSFDGVAFEGGTAPGTELVIGEGRFLAATEEYAGFEEQLVGHTAGEEFDITVQFPDPYKSKPEYASKVAVFHIKMNGVYEMVMPELNDEWVQANGEGAQTVEEYREKVREILEENSEFTAKQNNIDAAFNALLNEIEVKSYPEGKVEEQKEIYTTRYQTLASAYGMDLATFLSVYKGITEIEFDTQAQTAAENYVKIVLACELLSEKLKLNSTGDEYDQAVANLANHYGYEDAAQFVETYGEEMIKTTIMEEKVAAYLIEKSVEPGTEDAADEPVEK